MTKTKKLEAKKETQTENNPVEETQPEPTAKEPEITENQPDQ